MYVLLPCLILTLSLNLTNWRDRADRIAASPIVADSLLPISQKFTLNGERHAFRIAGQFGQAAQRVVSHTRQSAVPASPSSMGSSVMRKEGRL